MVPAERCTMISSWSVDLLGRAAGLPRVAPPLFVWSDRTLIRGLVDFAGRSPTIRHEFPATAASHSIDLWSVPLPGQDTEVIGLSTDGTPKSWMALDLPGLAITLFLQACPAVPAMDDATWG